MVDIDIFGSCITRDVFEYDNVFFRINEFISRCSILSAVSLPPRNINVNYDGIDFHKWAIKCIKTDFTKDVFSRLSKSTANVLVIDLIDERHKLIKFLKDGAIVTDSVFLRESKIMESIDAEYEILKTNKLSKDVIEKAVLSFSAKISSIYENCNIVINKGFLVDRYRSKAGGVLQFDKQKLNTITFLNEYLEELYGLMEENIPGCHIIEMPKDTVADENNKWGLEPFHYTEKFYRNVLDKLKELYG